MTPCATASWAATSVGVLVSAPASSAAVAWRSEALVQAGRLGEALADLPIAVMSLQSSLGADHPESVFWLIRLAEMSTLSQ